MSDSSYVDPRVPDPRFPDRPTHPDFVRMSEAVQANDRAAEAGNMVARTEEFVDIDSLEYMVTQRAGIGRQRGLDDQLLAAAIMDGFVLGCAYMKAKEAEREPSDAQVQAVIEEFTHSPTFRVGEDAARAALRAAFAAED